MHHHVGTKPSPATLVGNFRIYSLASIRKVGGLLTQVLGKLWGLFNQFLYVLFDKGQYFPANEIRLKECA